jgi:DNA adenine methylase
MWLFSRYTSNVSVRSPLRYPGGKQRALTRILERFPQSFSEFREPFVGGGSVFIAVRQQYPEARVWINDLNADLYAFWLTARDDLTRLVNELRRIKNAARDGRALFVEMRSSQPTSTLERAVRFFVLNRITFSGTTDSGGYSSAAFETRFTRSSLDRLERLDAVLDGVRITNLDYAQVVDAGGEDAFVFLDPPYLSATQSRLYGRSGDLHLGFDHAAFARALQVCAHPWLVTYDDSLEIRRLFGFARLEAWQLQYGMNNVGQGGAAKGNELFISSHGARNEPLVVSRR